MTLIKPPSDETLVAALLTVGASVEVDEGQQHYVLTLANGSSVNLPFGSSVDDFIKAAGIYTPVEAVAPVEETTQV